MKTILSSGIVGCLSLSFFACAGADDSEPLLVGAAVAAEMPEAKTSPDETVVPVTIAPESDLADTDTTGLAPPAVGATSVGPEAPVTPRIAAGAELHWRACGQFEDRNLECAELNVPIDYAQPDAEQLPIAMRRILASPLEPHRGSLLINPGGPGGEGIDYALAVFERGTFDQIAPGFDIVGFDPRGVAASGERGCGIVPEDMYPEVTTDVDDDGPGAYVSYLREEGEQCEKEWGPLFRKLGSNNVVRDMEEIRKALKEPVLNFYGASYGTRLGALYAHEYPETTGRIVLDAPVHPRANFVEIVRGQFYQALALHEAVFSACEAGSITCPPNPRQVFDQILVQARQRGLEQAFTSTWKSNFASPIGLQRLLDALAAEAADPGGEWILAFVGAGGGDIGFVSFAGVSCTDDTVEPPTIEQIESVQAEFVQAGPVFASSALSMALCTAWPTTRDPAPLPTAMDAPPLLVIGGVADSRTPLPWAQAMTETLGNATLLTSNHFGHGGVSWGGDCVKQNIRAYLTSGSMPATGATCD